MKTELEKLIEENPNMEYWDGTFAVFENDDIIQVISENADYIIEQHYEGYTLTKVHSSGAPWLEEEREVSGAIYIESKFNNNYERAFNEAQ